MIRHALIITRYSVRVAAIALGIALFSLVFGTRAAWAHDGTQLLPNCGACPVSENVAFIPTSGQAGVVVRLSISDSAATSAATYVLVSTRAKPTSASCAAAQPIPGVAPIKTVVDSIRGGAEGQVAFHWPSALGPGQYWFCARPQSGVGATIASSQPFTAVSGPLPPPQIQLEYTKLLPGAGTHATLTNWNALDPTTHFSLAPQGTPETARIVLTSNVQRLSNSTTDPNTYTYLVTMPDSLKAGTYVIVAEADCASGGACAVHAQSVPITVPSLTPAATQAPQNPSGGVIGLLTSGPQGLLLAAGALCLLLVVVFLIVAPLVRRGRAREAAVASQQRVAGRSPGANVGEDWQRSGRNASGYARYDEPESARRVYDDHGRSERSGPSGGQSDWRRQERRDPQRGL